MSFIETQEAKEQVRQATDIVALIGAVDYWGFLGDFDVGKPDLPADVLEKRQTQADAAGAGGLELAI